MKRNIWNLTPVLTVLSLLIVLQTVYIAFAEWRYAVVSVAISASVLIYSAVRLRRLNKDIGRYIYGLSKELQDEGSDILSRFAMPVLVTRDTGEIIWYNEPFRINVLRGHDAFGEHYGFIISDEAEDRLTSGGHADVTYDGGVYTVYESESDTDGRAAKILFFIDETELRLTAQKYGDTRPVVIYMTVDNMEEVAGSLKNSERAAFSAEINDLMDKLAQDTNSLSRKLADDRYMLITEEQYLNEMQQSKFSILRTVKEISVAGRSGMSLSIGAGCGDSLRECDANARQALDMALGRGGDQAAVKDNREYKFYGGAAAAVERRTKVRARVVASALKELILSSDNVLIMGHRFADLDALGAAAGLLRAVTELEKPGKIVMTRAESLALPLLERMEQHGVSGAVIEPAQAIGMITRKTLLIVVDTHIAELLDSTEIYNRCETVVVIDHHRRTVDYINNAVIFYHEPYASSACELVTELLQYIGGQFIGSLEAEALMSGIMLDTRNFVLRTGVRTFEAAGFLRGRGADPVEVKKLFAGSMELYVTRSQIISSAKIVNGCAISATESRQDNIRIAAAQAADELLSISGVDASFVLTVMDGGGVNISARSLGKINVQLIMEALGGGGHQTMAAAQLRKVTITEAKRLLTGAIGEYISDRA